MSRRLEKLIEQKAWETLTDYGYNDAHLLEQLTESVLDRLYEETPKERRAREFAARRKYLERRRKEHQKKLAKKKAARDAKRAKDAQQAAGVVNPASGGSAGRGSGISEAFKTGYRFGLSEAEGIEMGGDPRRPVGGRPRPAGLTDPQKLIDRDLRRIREIEKELRDREDDRNIRRFRDIKRDARRGRR